jgi:hypothetical protein
MVDIWLECGNPPCDGQGLEHVKNMEYDLAKRNYAELWQCPKCKNAVFLVLKHGEPKP